MFKSKNRGKLTKEKTNFPGERLVDVSGEEGNINENLERIYFALDRINADYKNRAILFDGVGRGY